MRKSLHILGLWLIVFGFCVSGPALSQTIDAKSVVSDPAKDEVALTNAWADILTRYTFVPETGPVLFDYARLSASKQDMDRLSNYIDDMASRTPSTLARDDAMAYWANLYNALTVQVVAQNYPVQSIRDIKSGWRAGPWKRKLVTVEGQTLSLDNIEHDILRPQFQTPMVHYMVNCASIGCPDLKTTPWRGATLAADLQEAARRYINDPRGVSVSGNRLTASKIYKWFKHDFGSNDAAIIAHFRAHADPDLLAALSGIDSIDSYVYDWKLNQP